MAQFPSLTSASGIWTLKKQKRAAQGSNWPPLVLPDFQFNYVTLLLHGNGTNGAQNNTFLDSSTNAFSMTRNGTITQGTFSPYGSNWSNYFNGTSDFLTPATSNAFAFGTGAWTVEAWVFVTTLQELFVFDTRNSFTTAGIGCRIASNGTLSYSGSFNLTLTSSAITANTWNHVAWVYDGTTLSGYINGVLGGTATPAFNLSMNTPKIGRNGNAAAGYMAGYISNLRVVKGTAVYTSAFTPPTAPLTAITNTSLLTCQSNQFRDASTNNFAITRTGDVSVEKFSPFLSSAEYSAATVGGSAYAAGTGYLTTTGQCLPQGTSDCCVEFWWYPMNFSDNVGFCKANVGQGIQFEYQGSGSFATVSFEIYTQGAGGVSSLFGGNAYASTGRFQVRQWNHVAYVRTGDTHSIYCNGIRLYTRTDVIGLDWAASTNNLILTSFTHQRYLNGYVSSFRSVVGSSPYDANNTTITVPTSQLTAITNTRLLLNFTNGGIIDNSMMNDLETVFNAQISTSVSKFGGGSIYFDGNASTYLRMADNPNFSFGSGDWTIEGWVYTTTSGDQCIAFIGGNTSFYGVAFRISGAGLRRLQISISKDGTVWALDYTATTGGIPLNTFTHVAVVRSGSNILLFENGTQVGTTQSLSGAVFDGTLNHIGTMNGANMFTGYLDDFRITKGYARYTANFTPPAAPFPDKGAL